MNLNIARSQAMFIYATRRIELAVKRCHLECTIVNHHNVVNRPAVSKVIKVAEHLKSADDDFAISFD